MPNQRDVRLYLALAELLRLVAAAIAGAFAGGVVQ